MTKKKILLVLYASKNDDFEKLVNSQLPYSDFSESDKFEVDTNDRIDVDDYIEFVKHNKKDNLEKKIINNCIP